MFLSLPYQVTQVARILSYTSFSIPPKNVHLKALLYLKYLKLKSSIFIAGKINKMVICTKKRLEAICSDFASLTYLVTQDLYLTAPLVGKCMVGNDTNSK